MRRLAIALILSLLPAAPAAANYDLTPEGNASFLAAFGAQPDVVKLPDGVMYRVVKSSPKGTSPLARQDIVTVEYMGLLINGSVFDRTKPDEPRTFEAGGVIPGWSEILYKMKTGDEWQVAIPAAQGYGAAGVAPVIPPNQTLYFTIKLEKVEYP